MGKGRVVWDRGQHAFSAGGHRVSTRILAGHMASVTAVRLCDWAEKAVTEESKQVGIAVFQQNFTYKKQVADYIWLQFADLN